MSTEIFDFDFFPYLFLPSSFGIEIVVSVSFMDFESFPGSHTTGDEDRQIGNDAFSR